MAKAHLKRIAAPRAWPIQRKRSTFIRRPRPGMHSLEHGMSIETWLKEVLHAVRTSREARHALREGLVKVNGRVVKDPAFITGFLDLVTLTPVNEQYLILLTPQGKLAMRKITPTHEKLSTIKRKVLVKGGKYQYTTREGYTFLTDEAYPVGEAVIINLESHTISKTIPLKEGSRAFIISGENIGLAGTVKTIEDGEVIISLPEHDVRVKRENIIPYDGYTPLEEALKQEE